MKTLLDEPSESGLAAGDVLLDVYAASFRPGGPDDGDEWVGRHRRALMRVPTGHAVSGVVAVRGSGTTELAVGDRVFGLARHVLPFHDSHWDGDPAEYVTVEAQALAVLPDGISHFEAAALVLPGLAAWQALFTRGGLRAGQSVLVHDAGRGAGALAVQLARAAGARVVGTGRPGDRVAVLAAGADVFISMAERLETAIESVDLAIDLTGDDVFVVRPDRGQLAELARRVRTGELRLRLDPCSPPGNPMPLFPSLSSTSDINSTTAKAA